MIYGDIINVDGVRIIGNRIKIYEYENMRNTQNNQYLNAKDSG